ncbi:hypothetical protein NDU88_002696 [Pleurodeles waltl]|uniref:Uncharacterized protein n=1 Tax=Pleurodeles waltl TaxID=8319 RepID=A0AAV7TMD6_PLEWA|nr:hypothetical protein NDU88_002696 [Pleurodeles waltl]
MGVLFMNAAPHLFRAAEPRALLLPDDHCFTSERLLRCTALAPRMLFSTPEPPYLQSSPPQQGMRLSSWYLQTVSAVPGCWFLGLRTPVRFSAQRFFGRVGPQSRSPSWIPAAAGDRCRFLFSRLANFSDHRSPRVPAVLRCWGRELLCCLG